MLMVRIEAADPDEPSLSGEPAVMPQPQEIRSISPACLPASDSPVMPLILRYIAAIAMIYLWTPAPGAASADRRARLHDTHRSRRWRAPPQTLETRPLRARTPARGLRARAGERAR